MNSASPQFTVPAGLDEARGWKAELDCTFEPGPDRTIVRRSHRGPLSIQRPFYPEGRVAHVYMLHPPGGVVAGDRLSITVHCARDAEGLVTTPGATKFYRSDGQFAEVRQLLCSDGGALEWFPQENIYFSGSKVNASTVIRLNSGDSFSWWEISCFGRDVQQERYDQGSVSTVVDLYMDSVLLLRERLLVNAQYPLSMSCGMRNHRVSGTLVLTPMQPDCLDYVRQKLVRPEFSATCFDSLLIVRYMGDSSEQAKEGFALVWSSLRSASDQPGRAEPRIWAT